MQGMDGRSGSSPVIRHSFEMVLVNQHNLLRGFELQTFFKAIWQAYGVGTMAKRSRAICPAPRFSGGPSGIRTQNPGIMSPLR